MSELNSKVKSAAKWSSITELAAKLVSPITTMVLARVLTPEAFGVLVTATMVISFAEIFTDAGFQKYIVQHEFESDTDLFKHTTVAFWSNLITGLLILSLICVFSDHIAELVGNKGYGLVISISSICIPLAAFSSIQMALFKRNLDFKTLFIARMVGVSIPIVITIPLALILRSYWALIGGMLALNLSNAIIFSMKSNWKPIFWYKWIIFKQMFSFTFWSMMEAISIWLTSYVDIFIVGKLLNEYYLGLYRTSMTTVGQFISIVTAATTPVLFSSLSRLQKNHTDFKAMFFKFQKIVSLLILPLGAGIYIFRNLITEILLGSQWKEAAFFIGIWALTSSIMVVLSHYSSECYRAKGLPKLSTISQILHLIVLVPVILWAIPYGFKFLCEARSLVRFEAIIVNMIFMAIFIKISPTSMLRNIFPSLLGASTMLCFGYFLKSQILWINLLNIITCTVVYLVVVISFPKERYLIRNLISYLIHNKKAIKQTI